MKKLLILAVVVIVLLPVITKMMPKAITVERFEAALTAAGLAPQGVQRVEPPNLEAVEQHFLSVNSDSIELYRYDDRGKIAKQVEFQKKDAGSVMVEAWNLSEKLGAAKPASTPSSAARNGMSMVVITSEDAALRQQVISLFKSL